MSRGNLSNWQHNNCYLELIWVIFGLDPKHGLLLRDYYCFRLRTRAMTTGRTRTGASWGPSWRGSWAARPQEDRYLAAAVAAGRVFRPPTAVAQPLLRPAAYLAPRLLPSWRPAAYLTHRQTPLSRRGGRPRISPPPPGCYSVSGRLRLIEKAAAEDYWYIFDTQN